MHTGTPPVFRSVAMSRSPIGSQSTGIQWMIFRPRSCCEQGNKPNRSHKVNRTSACAARMGSRSFPRGSPAAPNMTMPSQEIGLIVIDMGTFRLTS